MLPRRDSRFTPPPRERALWRQAANWWPVERLRSSSAEHLALGGWKWGLLLSKGHFDCAKVKLRLNEAAHKSVYHYGLAALGRITDVVYIQFDPVYVPSPLLLLAAVRQ